MFIRKLHWHSGGKRLTLFSWAHAQKQEAARRSAVGKVPTAVSNAPSADGKGPSADSKGPSADGKVPPADSKGPSADSKGPSADSNGSSADGKGSSAGADKTSPPPSQHQSNGLLGEHLLITETMKMGSLSHSCNKRFGLSILPYILLIQL
jgi:hypothetical protein